ncbi:bifunctional folylpolyglutamate synthase/dihydrofolate synthase [Mucilaginibacter auburnensis]|uniref:Dihydrofolate synthase/folylpolyglutamate synthase n=1 Tax=Mucilaginibacter auburnensis TaxID=1457233 RepID=A0A2H9VUU6_9SPHI|nr:folylpolyglutamate synthase/dihydrofolate synthase family protein [Mucilaginibacter auburnensis]PJJ84581.1 dihydrofolate synthase/folylpolyglutamate synthase [Mucilaginibacter auburnensis]
MNYQETINYLYTRLPMFSRTGAAAITKDLTNTITLCQLLGNPENKFKSVHIAGTNGKGSTSHMLAAILQTAGYKTGLYTSPHLKDFRERVRVNGQMISEQAVTDFVAQYKEDFEQIGLSFFEMTVGLAFEYFANHQVDIAIIETGLGGRLDSTNVITPLLSVITNIGWDHTDLLGNTLPLIAAEKAGIIKPNIPVVIGERQEEVAEVFMKKAEGTKSPIYFAADEWEVVVKGSLGGELLSVELIDTGNQSHYELELDLTGSYQLKNVKTVLSAVMQLRQQGFTITDEHLKVALQQVKTLTGLHGRWEVLSRSPLTICDTGHNPDGIEEVLKNIAATPHKQLHFVMGMVSDKDSSKVLALLPKHAIYYFCRPDIPRGLDAVSLKEKAADFWLNGESYPSVKEALTAAQKNAKTDDLVFVGGSTFVVAEVI